MYFEKERRKNRILINFRGPYQGTKDSEARPVDDIEIYGSKCGPLDELPMGEYIENIFLPLSKIAWRSI